MASVYGGVLLIGAEGGSQLARYNPLSESDANEACEAYELAAKDRCLPAVPVSPEDPLQRGVRHRREHRPDPGSTGCRSRGNDLK